MIFWRKRRESELDKEIEAHLAMATRELIENGETAQDAKQAAQREFGNRTLIQETTREMWGWNFLSVLLQDIRYALRGMRRNLGFTSVAILSIALGTGVNTAIFSVTDTVLLRLLPVSHPEELVELLQKYPNEPRGNGYWTLKSYEHFRDNNHVFSNMVGTSYDNHARIQVKGSPGDFGIAEYVTENYFNVLGVQAAVGRTIGPINDASSAIGGVAVLSWNCWQSRFDGDPNILGQQIIVQDKPATIIGIAPRQFVGLRVEAATEVWLPREETSPPQTRLILARLKPGVTIDQARAEMAVLYQFTIEERWARSKDPQVRALKVEIEPAGNGLSTVRDRFSKPLLALTSIAGILLLITCVNIASMLLARGASREREMAVRVGLGASRGRLIRQVLTESALLSLFGTVGGVMLSYFGTAGLLNILASGRVHERILLRVQPNLHLLLFSAAVALFAGLLFGLAPAWHAFRARPASSLRQHGGTGDAWLRRLFERGLVSAQIALSVILLSAAGLFVAHLWNLKHVDLGFRRDHVLLVTLDASKSGYRPERLASLYQALLVRAEQIPGVRSATLCGPTPLSGAGASGFASVRGVEEKPTDHRWNEITYIAPKYFSTIGTPLRAGREITLADQNRSPVAVLNERMASFYFPEGSPIGKHITLFHVTGVPEPRSYEIVGVAGDANYLDIREEPSRIIYLPAFQANNVSANNLVLRTNIDPEKVVGSMRRVVNDLLKTVPIGRITTLNEQIDASIVPERLVATLSGYFAVLGVLLASIGVYGLLAYTVARRVNEIGIRLALGASPGDVTRMVFYETLTMVIAGLALGTPLAIWGRSLATNFTQDLTVQTEGPLFVGAALILAGALLASYVPARRAARVDPMQALRHE